jgi:hypothetical protein
MHRLLVLSALAVLPAFAGAEWRFSADRNFDIPAAGVATVTFDAGSTDVVVEGVPGLGQIEVRGRACASDASWLDRLTVDQQRNGNGIVITPHDGHDLNANWLHSNYAYVNLRVRVPTQLAVVIKSESGDADVSNVASLDFNASSGDLLAGHIAGPLSAEVSSGDIHAEDLGSAEIGGTSSGDITLHAVHGEVNIARSGSGDLNLHGIGSARIGSVGSGDVRIGGAAGNVDIDSIGSGDVSVDDIGGDFHVGARGSGDISHRSVRGKISVPRDNDDD